VKKQGKEKTTRQILEAAVAAKDPVTTGRLVRMISAESYWPRSRTGQTQPRRKRSFKLDLTETAPLWRALIEDKRTFDDGDFLRYIAAVPPSPTWSA